MLVLLASILKLSIFNLVSQYFIFKFSPPFFPWVFSMYFRFHGTEEGRLMEEHTAVFLPRKKSFSCHNTASLMLM